MNNSFVSPFQSGTIDASVLWVLVEMIAGKQVSEPGGSKGAAASLTPAPSRPFDRDDFDRNVWSVLGLPIDLATAPQAVEAVDRAVRDRTPLSFITPNVNFLVRALRHEDARRQMIDADLSLVDGAPLVAIGRLLGAPMRERCAGSDVFDALRRRAGFPGRRLRVFFFGGRPGAAKAAAAAIDAEGRGVEAAGFFDPGAGDVASMSADETIDRINAANADFVLVALGAAKGQEWISRNRRRLTAPVVSHLGAVIDFTAGTIARAPLWVRRLNLEWAWRIKEEPALWRRYWSDAVSLAAICAERLVPALMAKGGPAKGRRATASVARNSERTVVSFDGDLTALDLDAARRAFRDVAREGRDVVLELGEAGRLDAAFLGLLV
ncbi:MAG: WecB/TagA/CpsF family glycosyltransferase, partial [Parvularculaceae bacterium]|nr:WecB/TagA/CpsF family glycosyltransferase [Parvularculaceae bacterium]